jgi:hypothetical protein
MVQSIEKSFSPKGKELKDERKERLSGKRKEILAKVRSKAVMTRAQSNSGVELNGSSNSGVESEESGDVESELEEQLERISLNNTSQPSQPRGLSPGRTKMKSSSFDFTPKTSDDAKKSRRALIQAPSKTAQTEEEIARLHENHAGGNKGETNHRRTVSNPGGTHNVRGGISRKTQLFHSCPSGRWSPPRKDGEGQIVTNLIRNQLLAVIRFSPFFRTRTA